jgi:Cytochrome b5-like Heme/Steroid binding domain
MQIRLDFLLYFVLFNSMKVFGSEIEYDSRFLQDRDVTYTELETHKTFRDGLWTALDGVVYDITDYVHPGGRSYLLYVGGIEGDDTYLSVDKKHHYLSIAQVVKEEGIVRIGPLVGEAPPPTAPVSPAFPVSSPVSPITPNAPTTPVKAPERAPSATPDSKTTRVPVSEAPVWSMGASKPVTKSPDASINEDSTISPTELETSDAATSGALETTIPDTLAPKTPPPAEGSNTSESSPPTPSSGIHVQSVRQMMIGVLFYSWFWM